MGQPVRRLSGSVASSNNQTNAAELNASKGDDSSDDGTPDFPLQTQAAGIQSTCEGAVSGSATRPRSSAQHVHRQSPRQRPTKRVYWKSPFFIKCKFGVLQYVLLKFLCAIAVLILEWQGLYKEGHFNWSSGYLYICILTNVSQCWALYSLIFFYYATKTELSPIRPVGKFLSVKALVFFTWWQVSDLCSSEVKS
jgi:Organic solute transporter Ostalpha